MQVKEIKNARKITELVSDYRKENDRFVDKVNKLQRKLKVENLRSRENSYCRDYYDEDKRVSEHYSRASPGSRAICLEKPVQESTTSYFTDEEEEYAVRDYRGRKNHSRPRHIYDEYEAAHENAVMALSNGTSPPDY